MGARLKFWVSMATPWPPFGPAPDAAVLFQALLSTDSTCAESSLHSALSLCPPRRPRWADSYHRVLIGFVHSWASDVLNTLSISSAQHADTCSHMQGSVFRLLYLKISADDDPNCEGKRVAPKSPANGYILLSFAKRKHLIMRLQHWTQLQMSAF